MKKLIAVLVASLFAAVTYTAFADDKPVKSGGPSTKPGRAADDTKPAAPTTSKKSSKKSKKKTAPQS